MGGREERYNCRTLFVNLKEVGYLQQVSQVRIVVKLSGEDIHFFEVFFETLVGLGIVDREAVRESVESMWATHSRWR